MRHIYTVPIALLFTVAAHAQSGNAPMTGMDHMHMDHAAHMAAMAQAQRQAQVAERGKDVMPFSLDATLHVFTKDAEGGIQQVVARDAKDATQTASVRQHLKDIRAQFLKGDFSGPGHIHGADMPGLKELAAAQPGQISIAYQDIPGGAQLSYRTREAVLVAALHEWFEAQVSDHGKDAMAGHAHPHHMGGQPGTAPAVKP